MIDKLINTKNYTSKSISFNLEKDINIYGKLYLPQKPRNLGLILFHGGKAGTSERFIYLQPALAKEGIANLAIDFRGKGKSSGTYEKSTLNNRIHDAKAAIHFLAKYVQPIHIGIIGLSLAGDMVRLLNEFPDLKIIILIGPVATYQTLVDISPPHIAHVISKKENTWKDSTVFSLLRNFSGSKLVIYGDKEDIATPEMIEEFRKSVLSSGQFVLLKNTGHNPFIIDKKVEKRVRLEQINTRKKVTDIIIKFAKEHL